MAPTPSPLLVHSPDPPSGRYRYHLHRQGLILSPHPPRRPSAPRSEQSKARALDAALQPSMVLEGPPPPPIVPTPSEPAVPGPGSSAMPVRSNQPQGSNRPGDMSGNIVAAVAVIVLILGGLICLVVGGEIQRRRARIAGERVSPPPSTCSGRRKSKPIKNTTRSLQHRTQMSSYDEKMPTPLIRPPPVLDRERQRRLSDIWPIRGLSRVLGNRRPCLGGAERNFQHSPPVAKPQTTWSEFSPVSLYVAPPRTVLTSIPEELEDCQSQTTSEIAATLGITFQRSLESPVVLTPQTGQPESSHDMLLNGFSRDESSMATKRHGPQECQIVYESRTRDEDAKSLESSAPDMTSDGDESSRSSMASLESFEGRNDRMSFREEVFELRRAQTRSMQMNKGVLLSLSLKTFDDSQNSQSTPGECGPPRSLTFPDAEGGKEHNVERELTLAMLGENFSAVDLDEFPSPPSILPIIPSFVSGFKC